MDIILDQRKFCNISHKVDHGNQPESCYNKIIE